MPAGEFRAQGSMCVGTVQKCVASHVETVGSSDAVVGASLLSYAVSPAADIALKCVGVGLAAGVNIPRISWAMNNSFSDRRRPAKGKGAAHSVLLCGVFTTAGAAGSASC